MPAAAYGPASRATIAPAWPAALHPAARENPKAGSGRPSINPGLAERLVAIEQSRMHFDNLFAAGVEFKRQPPGLGIRNRLQRRIQHMALVGTEIQFRRRIAAARGHSATSEVDNELAVLLVERLPATYLTDLRQRLIFHRIPAPMQAIRGEIFALRVELLFRPPERDDVIVDLAIAGDFH